MRYEHAACLAISSSALSASNSCSLYNSVLFKSQLSLSMHAAQSEVREAGDDMAQASISGHLSGQPQDLAQVLKSSLYSPSGADAKDSKSTATEALQR